jgi:SAM-dependent methyltransferase
MCELGNKKNAKGTYKQYFESLGIRHVSIDSNGLDGAVPLDLRAPIDIGDFDIVTNFGTTEHVTEQEQCWKNVHNLVRTGGILVSMTPLPGHWLRHGLWYPTTTWYKHFALLNDYTIEILYVYVPRFLIFFRGRKRNDKVFKMPAEEHMFKNV